MKQLRTGRSIGAGLTSLGMVILAMAATLVAAGQPRATAQEKPAAQGSVTQRLVFAYYHYSYQGDGRKAVPVRDIRDKKGLSVLTDQPWESVGPWMSYDRAQWHKNQFQMMAAGGIDVALTVYRGDQESRAGWALKGLDVMSQGLKELRSEGLAPLQKIREYPQIALALDLRGLQDQYGAPVDLKVLDVQRSLYGMVRDFYLHIPEEFRATIQLPTSRAMEPPTVVAGPGAAPAALGNTSTANGAAYIVRLIHDEAVKDADNTFLAYVNRRFAQEFGVRLVWVGTPALRAKATGMDAAAIYPAATRPATVNSDGWVKIGSFGPGFDNSARAGASSTIRPRENGQQTLFDFKNLINQNVDWVFIDSWNGFGDGTDVAPSLQYGLLYRDLIRAAVLQYKQSSDYAADFLKASVPRVMQPDRVYQTEVVVQNSGTSDWDVFNIASLSYRWRKDGKYIGLPGASRPSPDGGQVRGDKRTYLIAVSPGGTEDAKTLPPGQYELEFNMNRRVGDEIVWFDQSETAPFRIPVTISADVPASRPYWISSTMTSLTKQGATYPATVRLRNDGSDTWKRGAVSVGYRWRKVSSYLKGGADDQDAVIATSRPVPISADVSPGSLVSVEVPIATMDDKGKPLPTWSPKENWYYVLEWDVYDGQRYLSEAGGATLREPVEVLDRDPAPTFLGCNLRNELIAGKTEMITVGLQNNGPDTWKQGRDKVVVHWYYMDGTEASWNDDVLPLQEDVPPFSKREADARADLAEKLFGKQPEEKKKKDDKKDDKKDEKPVVVETKGPKGEKIKVRKEMIVQPTVLRDVPVRVPYYFGPMYCVFDFQQDGLNASTAGASKGNDVLVVPVNIFSPTFTPLANLQALFDTDGVSQDVDRSDGNLDGRGNSFPAEFLPPYVPRPSVGIGPSASPLYPSGLWARPLNDLEAKRVCFWYPLKNNSVPNMMSCRGQKLEFSGSGRVGVHIAALATEEDVPAEFSLYYSDGTVEKRKVTVTHWNDPPKHGELVAFSTPHRHTRNGDDPSTRCYIHHYTLPADSLKFLVGLEFPRNQAIKVVAVTLESAKLALPPAP